MSALSLPHSSLRELDLSYNHPGPAIVRHLKALWEDPYYALLSLGLDPVGPEWMTL